MVDEPTTKPGGPLAKPSVETTKVELSATEWVDLGPGPMLVGSDGDVVFSVGDFVPRHEIRTGFFVLATWPPIDIRTQHHIWAMSATENPVTAFFVPL